MEIEFTNYDDSLTIKTSHGTEIHISVTECKTAMGVSGHTDQINISTQSPIEVKHYPSNPDDMALHAIAFGLDHFPECMRKEEPDWEDDDEDDPYDRIVYKTPDPPRSGQNF